VAMTKAKLRGFLHSAGSIAVAMAVMSVATYAFQMVAARLLGPQQYGAVAALMNVLLVVGVLALGLQATAARRISAEPEHVAQIERNILRVTYRAALALGLLVLVLAPVIDRVLKLDSLPTAALVAVAVVPITIMGGQAGILQGERRWFPLGVIYIASGVPRVVFGTALMMWRPTETWAMVGVVLGAFVPVVVGTYALRRKRDNTNHSDSHAGRAIVVETLHNSQALLAFFVLSNVDVIIARNVLDPHAAGLYAGGVILTKAVLFAPQFVVVIAFPSMSSAKERRTALMRSLGLVALLGTGFILGAWLLRDIAMIFVGGDQYADIEGKLWVFAILGTALSMLQLLVYSVLARQGRMSAYVVWLFVIVVVALGLTVIESLDGLLAVVTLADAALLVLLLGLSMWRLGEPVPNEDAVLGS